jgi:hypothetical protein
MTLYRLCNFAEPAKSSELTCARIRRAALRLKLRGVTLFAAACFLTGTIAIFHANAQSITYTDDQLVINGEIVARGEIDTSLITSVFRVEPKKVVVPEGSVEVPGRGLIWPGTGINLFSPLVTDDEQKPFYLPGKLGINLEAGEGGGDIFAGELNIFGIHIQAGQKIKESVLKAAGFKKEDLLGMMSFVYYERGRISLQYSKNTSTIQAVVWLSNYYHPRK